MCKTGKTGAPTKKQRALLVKSTKHVLDHSDCVELCAHWLSLIAGPDVHPLAMDQEDETVEACLAEFATEISVDEFIERGVSGFVVLFRSHKRTSRPVLYRLSPDLADRVRHAILQ